MSAGTDVFGSANASSPANPGLCNVSDLRSNSRAARIATNQQTKQPHTYSSGIESATRANAEYATVIRSFAASHRYPGTPNNSRRSIIARRLSGNGDAPNSIPRVSVRPLHGGVVRLRFSSQIPIHGKSDRFHSYPNNNFDAGAHAKNHARSRCGSNKCVENAADAGTACNRRMSTLPFPSLRGARGQSNTAPTGKYPFGPAKSDGYDIDRVPGIRNSVFPRSKNGGPNVTCCV